MHRTPIRRALALAAALVPLATLAAAPGGPAAQDPDAILRRSDAALARLGSLRAQFVQRVENPILERTEIGHGTLEYRAPDRFRIAYRYPAGDLVVNDGEWVWIYLPSSQPGQVIRQPAASSGVRNPLMYLQELRAGYAVAAGGVDTLGGAVADRLVLTPSSPSPPFAGLEVWVDRGSGLPRRVQTVTADGIRTTYTFTTLGAGAAVRADAFRFRVPRGVEVFDQ